MESLSTDGFQTCELFETDIEVMELEDFKVVLKRWQKKIQNTPDDQAHHALCHIYNLARASFKHGRKHCSDFALKLLSEIALQEDNTLYSYKIILATQKLLRELEQLIHNKSDLEKFEQMIQKIDIAFRKKWGQ